MFPATFCILILSDMDQCLPSKGIDTYAFFSVLYGTDLPRSPDGYVCGSILLLLLLPLLLLLLPLLLLVPGNFIRDGENIMMDSVVM